LPELPYLGMANQSPKGVDNCHSIRYRRQQRDTILLIEIGSRYLPKIWRFMSCHALLYASQRKNGIVGRGRQIPNCSESLRFHESQGDSQGEEEDDLGYARRITSHGDLWILGVTDNGG
jgi:hypothetical protein